MFGTRFFTFMTAALAGSTIVGAVVAGPNVARTPGSGAVEAIAIKRQTTTESQITSVLTNLQTTLDPILSSISMVFDFACPIVPRTNIFVSCTWRFWKR
jgi:hypothetical protein